MSGKSLQNSGQNWSYNGGYGGSNYGNTYGGYSQSGYNKQYENKFADTGSSFGYAEEPSGFASKTPVSTGNPWEVKLNASKPACSTPNGEKKDFEVGTMVLHPKFGIGNVMKVEGSGDNKSVTVNFKTVGVKTLVLSFAPLKIIK